MSKKQKEFQDGEQVSTEQYDDRFTAFFVPGFERLYDFKKLIEVKVFLYLANEVHFGSGRVHVTPAVKKRIISRLDISDVSLRNSLKSLAKNNVITNVVEFDKMSGDGIPDKYEYMLNPLMVWRGDPSRRFNAIKQFEGMLDYNRLRESRRASGGDGK